MNCVSERCKYVRSKVLVNDDLKYFKRMLVFECALGKSISYPLIDDHTRDMRCECYERQKTDKEKEMLRMTNYGVWVDDDGTLNENEKAMLYIKECAESVGIEVIEGKTAFSIPFVAEIMRRLRGTESEE